MAHEWVDGHLRLFISHLGEHGPALAELKIELASWGIDAFLAHDDIEPTRVWREVILGALRDCHALLAVVHPEFEASAWCNQEVGFVLARGIPVVSLCVGADPPAFLSDRQGLRAGSRSARELAAQIAETFGSMAELAEPATEGLVTAFERSSSYTEAMDRSKLLLARADQLSMMHARRLELAVYENDQIERAYAVPDRVKEIVERVRAREESAATTES